ncbi:hypothetical protein BDE40_1207 [Litoreibacter halocynthiae]|uniref:Uncharacterized protein n=1 Tax=Litoreibacter halocynthiae TaxID=1242689 RepID=A0A4R7LS81_9RHOB|nr:hypothetical protein [Litoreibacter halocynthiae]TDT77906.1 hypothetical protein BDE40_1207 [Litoreibacter halocynthiae]
MPVKIRPAELADIDAMGELLVQDGKQRQATDPILWTLAPVALEKVTSTIKAAMENTSPPFRQQWLLAEDGDTVVGLTHTILLPVPPIYAGEFGPPGLIMEDCFVTDGAPADTAKALLEAAEADLVEAGAIILLGSSASGGAWERLYRAADYTPLTLYFAKTGLTDAPASEDVREAVADDVEAIVASSAVNRQVLYDLNDFWKPHPDADARFGAWMARSLTLADRDMFVSEAEGDFEGYVISQPASALHFPSAHDVTGIGFIDDYFHTDYENPDSLEEDGPAAAALLHAAEAALKARGNRAALIVCPAAWSSKISLLQNLGYETAITWFIKS